MIKLNQNNIQAEQHFFVVKDLIQARIKNILSRGINKKKKKIKLSPSLKSYLKSLLDDNELKLLITARPDNLKGIITSTKNTNPDFFSPKSYSNFVLRNLFINSCYDKEEFSKLDFIKRIDIDTCPYCNRNYIYFLSKENQIKPQIDHFYPKSIYPILGVSFYNLIPSCQTCNGFGAKEEKDPTDEDLTNPYLLENDSFKFTYKIKKVAFLNSLHDKTSVEVKFRNQIQGHSDVFKLDKLYALHSDHVIELILKSKVAYSEEYRKYLRSYRDKGLKFSDSEIDNMILGNYSNEKEVHKRPLAKLYQDIGKELGLISST